MTGSSIAEVPKRNYPLLFAKGMAMGAADLVPGVSGGTIAFISGIYDELVDTLRGLTPGKLICLFREGFAAFWRQINGGFLLAVLAGILASVFALARVVMHGLEHYPLAIWSFFLGLILASILHVGRGLERWHLPQLLGLAVGTIAAALAVFLPPIAIGGGALAVFGAGALAICAMILPGISGSFILVLIGMYPVLIQAVASLDFSVLGTFACGALIGLLLFSHVLSWLLHHHRSIMLAVMLGFMVGSLGALWPWRIDLPPEAVAAMDKFTPVRQLLMPGDYQVLVGDPRIASCLLALAAGVVLVLGLEYLGSRFKGAGNREDLS